MLVPRLKQNALINIYQKPITDENFEGVARLYRHHSDEDDEEIGQRWTVRFANGDMVDRWVHPRNLVTD